MARMIQDTSEELRLVAPSTVEEYRALVGQFDNGARTLRQVFDCLERFYHEGKAKSFGQLRQQAAKLYDALDAMDALLEPMRESVRHAK